MSTAEIIIKSTMLSILSILCIIGSIATGLTLGKAKQNHIANPIEYLYTELDYDAVNTISCASNSMGLTMGCGDTVYIKYLEPNETLMPGRVYTYNKANQSVIHRLILCLDQDCQQTIFKGDNNYIGEKVNRSQITGRAIKINYN